MGEEGFKIICLSCNRERIIPFGDSRNLYIPDSIQLDPPQDSIVIQCECKQSSNFSY